MKAPRTGFENKEVASDELVIRSVEATAKRHGWSEERKRETLKRWLEDVRKERIRMARRRKTV